MSRIGKKPVSIPKGVKVALAGRLISVEGPKGKLSYDLPRPIAAKVEAENITFACESQTRQDKALFGLARALVANMVKGTNEGFVKKLEIQGVGFKAGLKGQQINLSLGFSHPVLYDIPAGIKVTITDQAGKVVPEGTFVTIEGFDKQLVGAVAADIRRYYPAEPYKGKGVRYVGEQIVRKEGKTAQGR